MGEKKTALLNVYLLDKCCKTNPSHVLEPIQS